jgi:hypothetical protein
LHAQDAGRLHTQDVGRLHTNVEMHAYDVL